MTDPLGGADLDRNTVLNCDPHGTVLASTHCPQTLSFEHNEGAGKRCATAPDQSTCSVSTDVGGLGVFRFEKLSALLTRDLAGLYSVIVGAGSDERRAIAGDANPERMNLLEHSVP